MKFLAEVKRDMRKRGMWITFEQALIIERAIMRAHIVETEPGADVIKKFLRRVDEMRGP